MWQAIIGLMLRIFRGRGERAEAVFAGYDRLVEQWQKLLAPLERRLTECERDRDELWRRIENLERRTGNGE